MKLFKRRPQKVMIAGSWWKIKYNKQETDARFDCYKKEMEIGSKSKKVIPENLLHEILEAILVERGLRYDYYESSNDKRIFLLNHFEMHSVCLDLLGAFETLS